MAVAAKLGFDEVSVSRVAEELGVTKAAVYRYVSSGHELRWLTANAISRTISVDIAPDSSWDEVLLAVMKAGREMVRPYPGLELLFSSPIPAEFGYPLVELALSAMYNAGFDDQSAASGLVAAMAIYAIGLNGRGSTANRLFEKRLPATDTPASLRAAPYLERFHDGDEVFNQVARLLIGGLRKHLDSIPSPAGDTDAASEH